MIVSPLNYIGGKKKILDQILPFFPSNINNFVDLFAGGANVGLNASAEKLFFNDNLVYLIELYKSFQKTPIEKITKHIRLMIKEYDLSLTNEAGYKSLRNFYNKNKNPLDLFVLIAYSFNHQIRFNTAHEFNNPFGRGRSCYNASMEANLYAFVEKIQKTDITFTAKNFNEFDIAFLNSRDFVYCDPPYLITDGTYNDGKRGFTGWGKQEEYALLKTLDDLNKRGIKFALSNVLIHKGKENKILLDWLENNERYFVYNIKKNYSNASYNTKNRDASSTKEVLITNYKTEI
jgi:DNA adenine methylase